MLADDDIDDCSFFEEALKKLPLTSKLVTVHNGEELMRHLNEESNELPQVLFLDLNMPRKNGFECLSEIKSDTRLKSLPVIVFSTSFDQDRAQLLYKNGAQYFMRKPAAFSQLKSVIHDALVHITHDIAAANSQTVVQPDTSNFVLTAGLSLPL